MSSGPVLGVNACRTGWAGIALSGGQARAYFAPGIQELADRAAAGSPLLVIAIDIPVGLPDAGRRSADVLARKELKGRWPSLFITPVRTAVEAADYQAAAAENRRLAGEGLSRQAFALRAKILDVNQWLQAGSPAPVRVVEAHPELSFAAMAAPRSGHAKAPGPVRSSAGPCSPGRASSWTGTSAWPGSRLALTTCSTRPRRPGPPGGSARVPRAACHCHRRSSATGSPLLSGRELPLGPGHRSGALQGPAAQMLPQPGQ